VASCEYLFPAVLVCPVQTILAARNTLLATITKMPKIKVCSVYQSVFDVEKVRQSELGRRYSVWTADFRRQNREKEKPATEICEKFTPYCVFFFDKI
jgi:hypothetical protein